MKQQKIRETDREPKLIFCTASTSNIYAHFDFDSKINSANAIMGIYNW